MNLYFERHMDPKTSMTLGEKIHLDTISEIEVLLLSKISKKSDNNPANILVSLNITDKEEGEEILRALQKLKETADIASGWNPNETIVINENKKTLTKIFPQTKKYSKKVIKNTTHVEIYYPIAKEDQKNGIIGKIGGDIIWKKSDKIFPICINEIRFNGF